MSTFLLAVIVGIWAAVAGLGFLKGAGVGAIAGYVTARWLMPGAAGLITRWLMPSGDSTPAPLALSEGEALQARGDYDAAIRWYESVLGHASTDPEPALRIARILRDDLHRYDEAVRWFRRARDLGLTPGKELAVTREIIDVFDTKLADPRRAVPELARLVDRFPSDPITEWARQELSRRRPTA